jgi:hypothetical protein
MFAVKYTGIKDEMYVFPGYGVTHKPYFFKTKEEAQSILDGMFDKKNYKIVEA